MSMPISSFKNSVNLHAINTIFRMYKTINPIRSFSTTTNGQLKKVITNNSVVSNSALPNLHFLMKQNQIKFKKKTGKLGGLKKKKIKKFRKNFFNYLKLKKFIKVRFFNARQKFMFSKKFVTILSKHHRLLSLKRIASLCLFGGFSYKLLKQMIKVGFRGEVFHEKKNLFLGRKS
jgi:hypothetical protein